MSDGVVVTRLLAPVSASLGVRRPSSNVPNTRRQRRQPTYGRLPEPVDPLPPPSGEAAAHQPFTNQRGEWQRQQSRRHAGAIPSGRHEADAGDPDHEERAGEHETGEVWSCHEQQREVRGGAHEARAERHSPSRTRQPDQPRLPA